MTGLDDERALILTLDFFPAIVDDPYIFGRVAAANALSDVHAMGGRPLFAMIIVGFPSRDLPIAVLGDMLRGGADKVDEAGGDSGCRYYRGTSGSYRYDNCREHEIDSPV